jgi:hypothetical protein
MQRFSALLPYLLLALAFLGCALSAPAPAPAPVADGLKLRQATRENIVARSRRQPAKRQTSAAPYPTCPDSPNPAGFGLVYATLFDTQRGTVVSDIQ